MKASFVTLNNTHNFIQVATEFLQQCCFSHLRQEFPAVPTQNLSFPTPLPSSLLLLSVLSSSATYFFTSVLPLKATYLKSVLLWL